MEDLTPSGKSRFGYSYPSGQKRQGPAPLASFEDLPSDEQVSPEGDGDDNTLQDLSPDEEEFDYILSFESRDVLQQQKKEDATNHSPTRTLTPANEILSPSSGREGGNWSTNIASNAPDAGVGGELLSPANGEVTPKFATSPLESHNGSARQSQGNLLIPGESGESGGDKTPSPDPRRKGSWTDIFFRGRSRSRSKSPIGSDSSPKSPNCEESSSKSKKGFFSFFKVGRKGSTASANNGPQSPMPSQENTPGSTNANNTKPMPKQCDLTTPRVSIVDTSDHDKVSEELTMPQDLNEPQESQQDIIKILEKQIERKINDLDSKLNLDIAMNLPEDEQSQQNKPTSSPSNYPPPILTRKLKSRADTIDDDCQSLPINFKAKELETNNSKNVETVVATIEHSPEKGYSSGSDLEESSATLNVEADKKSRYLMKQTSEASENDFEATTLLTQDSIDYEDFGPSELTTTPDTEDILNRDSSNKSSIRRRLDVNTIPVDRPRSTTPINIAPLEAFIATVSPTPDQNVEKIKLSLPGDQFSSCSRAKSPRKSNPQIWLDFCEKGLHSPKTSYRRRRRENFSPRDNPGGLGITATADAFTPVTDTPSQAVSPLTPITPLDFEDQWTPFGDNFNPYDFIKEKMDNNDRYKWSMECNKCDCLIGKLGGDNNLTTESNGPSGSNTPGDEKLQFKEENDQDEQPLVSPIACSCDCHGSFLSRGRSLQKQDCLFSISSDISSASSRLIQASSASSSKCSSVEEVEDKILS